MGNRIYLLFYTVAALSLVFALSAPVLLAIRKKSGGSVRAAVWLLFFLLTVVPVILGSHVFSLRLFTNNSGGMRIECRAGETPEPLGELALSARSLKEAETFVLLVLSLWFIAAVASVSYGISSYWNTLLFLTKNSGNCRDERINRIFADAKKKAGVRRPVALRVMHPGLRLSPCTCGTWSPSVFIGGDYLSEYSDLWLELVFLHELTHIRHNDALLRLAALFATSFHALLPVSGRIRQAVNEDAEYLCDRSVLALAGQKMRGEYIRVILDIAERNVREDYQPNDLLSNASQAGELLLRRYRRMQQTDSDRFRPVTLAAVSLALLLNAALLSFCTAENPENLRIDFASPVFADAMSRHFGITDPAELTEEHLAAVYSIELFRPQGAPGEPVSPVFYCIVNEDAPERSLREVAYPSPDGAVDLSDLALFDELETLILEGGLRAREGTWEIGDAYYAVILRD